METATIETTTRSKVAHAASRYLRSCDRMWQDSEEQFPDKITPINFTKRWSNERRCKRLLRNTKNLSSRSMGENRLSGVGDAHKRRYQRFMQSVLGFTKSETALIMQPACGQATNSFVQQVKAFDPDLSPQDIYQACRNVWMLNAIQMLLGKDVEITPSIFAYSLLYPYTDNFLDDPNIPESEKIRYFETFKRKLEGFPLLPENTYEERIFRLVDMIEKQYPRNQFPEVFDSMLEIHCAQQQSIRLLRKNIKSSSIRELVFHKGGTSVLADGFLVAGTLTDQQAEACYLLGVVLQLLDDLQDIEEDSRANLKTMYSSRNGHVNLDVRLNKTLHFVEKLNNYKAAFSNSSADHIIDLIIRSCHFYMLNNVCKYPQYYSKLYRETVKCRLPVQMTNTNIKRKELIYNYIRQC